VDSASLENSNPEKGTLGGHARQECFGQPFAAWTALCAIAGLRVTARRSFRNPDEGSMMGKAAPWEDIDRRDARQNWLQTDKEKDGSGNLATP